MKAAKLESVSEADRLEAISSNDTKIKEEHPFLLMKPPWLRTNFLSGLRELLVVKPSI